MKKIKLKCICSTIGVKIFQNIKNIIQNLRYLKKTLMKDPEHCLKLVLKTKVSFMRLWNRLTFGQLQHFYFNFLISEGLKSQVVQPIKLGQYSSYYSFARGDANLLEKFKNVPNILHAIVVILINYFKVSNNRPNLPIISFSNILKHF